MDVGEHEHAARRGERADRPRGWRRPRRGEVVRDALPHEDRRASRIEPRREELGVEAVALEVDGHVDDTTRVDALARDDRDLASLRGGMVDLERRQRAAPRASGAPACRTPRRGARAGRPRTRVRSTASSMNRVRATADGRGPGPGHPVVHPGAAAPTTGSAGPAGQQAEPAAGERFGERIDEEAAPGAPVGLERPHERHGLGGEAGPVLHCASFGRDNVNVRSL